jgi:hypothetical protein
MVLGSGIRDPEKNLFRIPDPGVKKAPDPGSATLVSTDSIWFALNASKPDEKSMNTQKTSSSIGTALNGF